MQVPAYVEYEKATSVDHALTLLARFGPEARVLAGGHSLIPMMKLRLAQPETLIDINGLTGLSYIQVTGGELRIGAMTRHAQLLDSAVAGEHFAILHDAERVIADPVVRLWGTVGGSLCQADPSEDLSAAFAALKATMVIQNLTGTRTVRAREFHTGPYETVVAPGELLTEIRIAIVPGGGSAYQKVGRRVGDWPVGAAGAAIWLDGGGDSAHHRRRRDRPHGGRRRALLRRGRRGLPARGAGDAGDLRQGRPDRGRALPPRRGPARARRLQAAPGRRAHRQGPACGSGQDDRSRAAPPASARRDSGGVGAEVQIAVNVNGTEYSRVIEPRLLLIHFIRDDLGLTGSHWGCDTSNCGACVVWLDDLPVKSCTVLAAMADGRRVRTVEGLERARRARPGTAGLRALPRAPVRVLHPRHDADRALAARPQPGPVGRRRSARRSPARSAAAPDTRTSSGPSAGPRSTSQRRLAGTSSGRGDGSEGDDLA